MWTCGIDIATQQATPATHEQRSQRVGRQPERPRVRRAPARAAGGACRARAARGAAAAARAAAWPRRRRRRCRHTSARQPTCRRSAAGSAARSRRRGSCRSRRSPRRCRAGGRTRARCRRPAARRSPSCRAGRSARRGRGELPEAAGACRRRRSRGRGRRRRSASGTMTPKRSASRPIRMPPMPKPIIGERVGQRRVGARDAELGLHRAAAPPTTTYMPDAAERHQRERDARAAPRRRAIPVRLRACAVVSVPSHFSQPGGFMRSEPPSVIGQVRGRLSEARRAHRQGRVRRCLGAQGIVQARPQPRHHRRAHRERRHRPAAATSGARSTTA